MQIIYKICINKVLKTWYFIIKSTVSIVIVTKIKIIDNIFEYSLYYFRETELPNCSYMWNILNTLKQ